MPYAPSPTASCSPSPAAIDVSAITPAPKTIPVLICGLKDPAWAQTTAQALAAQGCARRIRSPS
jgi:hypothetical protein